MELALLRKHKKDPEAKYTDYVKSMIERCRLSDSFEIPNTAGEIHLEVDLRRRTVGVSMQVDPPGDKKRPTAAINWLTRQLKDDKIKEDDLEASMDQIRSEMSERFS